MARARHCRDGSCRNTAGLQFCGASVKFGSVGSDWVRYGRLVAQVQICCAWQRKVDVDAAPYSRFMSRKTAELQSCGALLNSAWSGLDLVRCLVQFSLIWGLSICRFAAAAERGAELRSWSSETGRRAAQLEKHGTARARFRESFSKIWLGWVGLGSFLRSSGPIERRASTCPRWSWGSWIPGRRRPHEGLVFRLQTQSCGNIQKVAGVKTVTRVTVDSGGLTALWVGSPWRGRP